MSQAAYVSLFYATNGPGPFECMFCHSVVHAPWDLIEGEDKLIVHHIDGDDRNNAASNLGPMHNSCHGRHHNLGKPCSPGVMRANKARDRTPTMCECGAGPFMGMTAVNHHKRFRTHALRMMHRTTVRKREERMHDKIR